MPIVDALGPVRSAVLGAYVVLSAVAFVMYGVDKAASKGGRRRIPEATLHLVALAGGWPGALAGRRFFRHKTRKQPFRTLFWGTVAANGVAAAWLLVALSSAPS